MKCPNCGANIRVRDEYCAWCGNQNTQSGRHVQILRRYREETDATKAELERATLGRVPLFIRLLVIALLLGGFVTLIIIAGTSYEREEARREAGARIHAAEYTATLDRLLAERDHTAFARFIEEHGISVYGHYGESGYPYRRYKIYYDLNGDYLQIVSSVMSLYPYKEGSYDTMDQIVTRIGDNTNYFYKQYDRIIDGTINEDDFPDADALAAIADMEAQIRTIFVTYLGAEETELTDLPGMTDAQRKFLVERSVAGRFGENK